MARKQVQPSSARKREEASIGGALGSFVGENRYLIGVDDGINISYIYYEIVTSGDKYMRRIVRGARPSSVGVSHQMIAPIVKKRNVPADYWSETF